MYTPQFFTNQLLTVILSTPHRASLNIPPVIFDAPSFLSVKIIGTLNDFKAKFPCFKLHLNLESISYGFDFIEPDFFKHFFSVALETGSGIHYLHPGDEPDID